MAEQNQFEESPPATEAGPQPSEASAAPVLVPVSAEQFAQARRRVQFMIGAAVVVALALIGFIYKRSVDPIRALEAFDAGERLLKSARYVQAITSFDLAISLKSDMAEAYSLRAKANMALSKPQAALPDFTKVVELRPEDPNALLDRGSAHVTMQEFPEAIQDFNRALATDPKLAPAYNLRGSAVRAMGDPAKALADFEKAVELLPDMNNYFQRGATYQLLGQHQEAIEDFGRVINFEPGSAQAYFARAQSFRALGDAAAANRDHRVGRVLDGR